MIPKELKDKLGKFNIEYDKYFKEKVEELSHHYDAFHEIINRISKDFEDKTITILEKSDWEQLIKIHYELDQFLLEAQTKHGTDCVKCQGWIEQKLSGKSSFDFMMEKREKK